MSGREERVTRNETTTRQINEGSQQANTGEGEHIRVLCECGRVGCDRVLAITVAEYEAVWADPRRFAVARGHVMAEVEHVVARTDRYVVVEKREGTPRRGRHQGGPAQLTWTLACAPSASAWRPLRRRFAPFE